MYQIIRLENELWELKKQVALGKGNAAIRDRIVAIEILLDNVYYIDRQRVEKPTPFPIWARVRDSIQRGGFTICYMGQRAAHRCHSNGRRVFAIVTVL